MSRGGCAPPSHAGPVPGGRGAEDRRSRRATRLGMSPGPLSPRPRGSCPRRCGSIWPHAEPSGRGVRGARSVLKGVPSAQGTRGRGGTGSRGHGAKKARGPGDTALHGGPWDTRLVTRALSHQNVQRLRSVRDSGDAWARPFNTFVCHFESAIAPHPLTPFSCSPDYSMTTA